MDHSDPGFAIFPIPGNDRITIVLQDNAVNGSVLFDAQGCQIEVAPITRTGDRLHMDISELPSGMYMIQIQTGERFFTGRFIRE